MIVTPRYGCEKVEIKPMQHGAELYEEIAQAYIRLVEHDCPDAAAAIRQIHATVGPHAALRAALVVKLLQMEVQQNHYFPNLNIYAYLFEDYPEAIGSLEQAIASSLQTWGLPNQKVQIQNGNPPQLKI